MWCVFFVVCLFCVWWGELGFSYGCGEFLGFGFCVKCCWVIVGLFCGFRDGYLGVWVVMVLLRGCYGGDRFWL